MQAKVARTDDGSKFRLHALGLGRVAVKATPCWQQVVIAWARDPRVAPLQLGHVTPGLALAAWACDPKVAPCSNS